jgi:hypothetical protein
MYNTNHVYSGKALLRAEMKGRTKRARRFSWVLGWGGVGLAREWRRSSVYTRRQHACVLRHCTGIGGATTWSVLARIVGDVWTM